MEKISGTLKTIFDEKIALEIEKIKLMHKPSLNPKLVLIGGQPGAGKSGLEKYINSKNEYVCINGDEYRKYHPQYEEFNRLYGQEASKYTQQWAGEFTSTLVEFFKSNKYNVIIEGTFRTSELPLKEARSFKMSGYEIEADIMCINRYLSYISTIKRYEDLINEHLIPRMTPKEHHDLVVDKIADNVDELYRSGLFDSIKVFNRNLDKLYDSNDCIYTPKYLIENTINPETLTEEEHIQLKEELNYVRNLMENRNAGNEDFEKINNFENELYDIEIESNIYDKEIESTEYDFTYDNE